MRRRPGCPFPEKSWEPVPAQTMTLEEAMAEARRCLSLNHCDGCEACVLMCPDQAITKDPATQKAIVDLRYCKGCGLCAHICPKGAITMIPD